MAELNVQLKNRAGDKLNIKTLAALVTNAQGQTLENVEAGAQVNVLEGVQLNGTDLAITNKKVNVVIPDAAEYSIAKQAEAEDGYASTYYLTKDGNQVGAKINIAKDMVVQSGEVKTCAKADEPIAGLKKGDKYIDLLLANSDNQHIYISVTDLVDVYTQGNGIIINNNEVSIDTSIVATQTDIANHITMADVEAKGYALNSDLTSHIGDTVAHVTAQNKADWNAKQDALSSEQLSAIASVANKADKATSLSGYGIADAYTKTEIDNFNYITYEVLA